MVSRSVVLDLPARVLVDLFTNFVTLSDVGRLDAAYCSHSSRKAFMAILSCKELSFSVNFRSNRSVTSCMQWSMARKVKFDVMKFTQSAVIPERLLIEFFEKHRKHLKVVYEVCKVGGGLATAMQKITEPYEKLQVLLIHGTAEPQHVVRLLKNCPNLVRFASCGTHHAHSKAVESYFIGAYCPKVTSIKLSGQFQDGHLIGITACFPHVDALELSGTLSATTLVNITVSYRSLSKLCLSCMPQLEDRHVSMIAQGCPFVTDVRLLECGKLTKTSIAALCNCPLESVELINCNGLVSTAIAVMATELRGTLIHLSIEKCTNMRDLDLALLKQCTLLESLDISKTGLNNLQGLHKLLQSCTLLRFLFMDSLAVTDDILCAVAQYSLYMELISIIDCTEHTKVGILALAKTAHSLEEIAVGINEPVLNDLAIELMKVQYPRIRITTPLLFRPMVAAAKPVSTCLAGRVDLVDSDT